MTCGHLFAGIGGFGLAAEWAGLENVWSNEIDPFCCAVLRKNFKHRIIEDDIRNIGKHNLESIDILTGGPPCQPTSVAGNRKGTKDIRWLWPEAIRILGEVRPRYGVFENPDDLLTLENGEAFEQICNQMENFGYKVQTFGLPAAGVAAWHERDRIWIIAYTGDHVHPNKLVLRENSGGKGKDKAKTKLHIREGENGERLRDNADRGDSEIYTNPNRVGREGRIERVKETHKSEHDTARSSAAELRSGWQRNDLPAPTLTRVDDGLPNRMDRIKSLGNAIVPQVALEIFEAIKKIESL